MVVGGIRRKVMIGISNRYFRQSTLGVNREHLRLVLNMILLCLLIKDSTIWESTTKKFYVRFLLCMKNEDVTPLFFHPYRVLA
jgi:hypothetical protein